ASARCKQTAAPARPVAPRWRQDRTPRPGRTRGKADRGAVSPGCIGREVRTPRPRAWGSVGCGRVAVLRTFAEGSLAQISAKAQDDAEVRGNARHGQCLVEGHHAQP